jgi:60 kDa SS-A/Ro ribonucleoprotein
LRQVLGRPCAPDVLGGYASTQVAERDDVLSVGGFSDAVFEIVSLFAKGELGSDHFVGAIESVKLS